MNRTGIVRALTAAALFGLASPLAKLLVADESPVLVAGLLYLGSGVGLGAWTLARRVRSTPAPEARLRRSDLAWLAGAIVTGGIAGPALQMVGLAFTPASTASLLLNLEGVFTAVLAWVAFRENVDRRIALGMALIVAGGVVLGWTGRVDELPLGALAIVGACACWAIDNNLTRRIAGRDPLQIAAIKGLVAGAFNVGLALAQGARVPAALRVGATCGLGLASYGVSLVLFVLALRALGTARTAAYFSIAPFVGAVVSIALLGEPVTITLVVASALMMTGVFLHVTERHEHVHAHEAIVHDHRHVHDEHHRHPHGPDDPPGEPHAHPHRHEPLRHAHPHYPDAHHRHPHGGA